MTFRESARRQPRKDRSINHCRDWRDWKPDALARDGLRSNVGAAASLAYASGYPIGHLFIERSEAVATNQVRRALAACARVRPRARRRRFADNGHSAGELGGRQTSSGLRLNDCLASGLLSGLLLAVKPCGDGNTHLRRGEGGAIH